MNVWRKFHDNPSNTCWDVSVSCDANMAKLACVIFVFHHQGDGGELGLPGASGEKVS